QVDEVLIEGKPALWLVRAAAIVPNRTVDPPRPPRHGMPGLAKDFMAGRTAVVLQPSYLPWLGYFAQVQRSDVFVIYDDVQFDKHGWRNRNRIKTAQGAQWLTVPVCTTGQNRPTNRDVGIDVKQPWRKKHLASLR